MPPTVSWRDDRSALRALHLAPEDDALAPLLPASVLPAGAAERGRALVRAARAAHVPGSDVSDFLREFGLGTREGVALLCLAEALLRIPDPATADALIEDRLGDAAWERHLGHADSLAVNASTWAFLLGGRVLSREDARSVPGALRRLVRRLGEPVIRTALRQGMRLLARQFVLGRTIEEALARAASPSMRRWRMSFDMLGEAAKAAADAERYRRAYAEAIGQIGRHAAGRGPIEGPGLSVKLSALHPRYEPLQERHSVPPLIASLRGLALAARTAGIGLTVDAEEAARLELSLDVFAAVRADPALAGWDGLGLAVQAYQKRAAPLIDWIAALARASASRIPVRLVKGAYWDSEIKTAQVQGLANYPVFTRKAATDAAWLACARRMLAHGGAIIPAFATHNALSLAAILALAPTGGFEMQRLHGMGEALYGGLVGPDCPVRVYAPVGAHEDLLAYLVRRLLENGANTSFVHRLVDPAVPEAAILADPLERLRDQPDRPRPIPLPRDLYPDRANSAGIDLGDRASAPALLAAVAAEAARVRTVPGAGPAREIRDPADRRRLLGHAHDATGTEIDATLARLARGFSAWDQAGGAARAAVLERAADGIEADRAELLALLVREAGKTLPDAIAELREAADACRYYAARAREGFAAPRVLAGPTGERNLWSLAGRGVFAAIAPWNFPLAIFTGQIAAALAAGNAVAAKPAEQTPLIGARAVALLHAAGVPESALGLLVGDGMVGAALARDGRVAGVAFTGSLATARAIASMLAARDGPLIPLIAETGGVNAMIVDSSALPEQTVTDALASAFGSAGQRCSALRVLCLQEEIADRVLSMLEGAAATWVIGDPLEPATDIGPIIDAESCQRLETQAAALGPPRFLAALPAATAHGSFFAPRIIERPTPMLATEIFGPVLQVVRFAADRMEALVATLAASGHGLTLGIQSRIESLPARILRQLPIGNAYVNRSQIGAVIGVQPFGGRGLSGTGPKAGGPLTLHAFAEERTVSVNSAAFGGDAALLATGEA